MAGDLLSQLMNTEFVVWWESYDLKRISERDWYECLFDSENSTVINNSEVRWQLIKKDVVHITIRYMSIRTMLYASPKGWAIVVIVVGGTSCEITTKLTASSLQWLEPYHRNRIQTTWKDIVTRQANFEHDISRHQSHIGSQIYSQYNLVTTIS